MTDEISGHRSVNELVQFAWNKLSRRYKRDLESSGNDNLPEIYEENFNSTIASGTTIVSFCVPWCTHCQHVLDHLSEAKQNLIDDPNIKIFKCDCTNEDNYAICFAEINKGVPTTSLYVNGERRIHDYSRATAEEFEDMIRSNAADDPDVIKKWKKRDRERKKKRRAQKNVQKSG